MTIIGEINPNGKGKPIEDGFRDGLGKRADGLEAVFPIIQIIKDGVWKPVGTGFFISNNGLFATAKHVLFENDGEKTPNLYGVQLHRKESKILIREIKKICRHDNSDVAVGFLFDKSKSETGEQTCNKCFDITDRLPEEDDYVVTIAFPQSEVEIASPDEFELKLSSKVFRGKVDKYHPDGRDKVLLPGRCFQTTVSLEGGASGGPVAYGSGSVFGINSTSFDGENLSYVTSIKDLLEIEIPNLYLPDGTIVETISVGGLCDLNLISLNNAKAPSK